MPRHIVCQSPGRANRTIVHVTRLTPIHMCASKAHLALADCHASGPSHTQTTISRHPPKRWQLLQAGNSGALTASTSRCTQAVHRTNPDYSGIRVELGTGPAKTQCQNGLSMCPAFPTDRLDNCEAHSYVGLLSDHLIVHRQHSIFPTGSVETLVVSVRP